MKRIGTLFRRARQVIREEGFLPLFKRALFPYSTAYLWESSLDDALIPYRDDNLTLQIITCIDEFDELLAERFDLSWYQMSVLGCKERLSKGAILFCALIGKEVAYISWAGTTKKHHDFYVFPVDYQHEAAIGGTMTVPKLRGRGIHTWATSKIHRYLREKGKSRAVLEIGKDNVAAQKTQLRLGSRIFGETHHLRLLGLFDFRWVTPVDQRQKGRD